jgi:hypothetical protein
MIISTYMVWLVAGAIDGYSEAVLAEFVALTTDNHRLSVLRNTYNCYYYYYYYITNNHEFWTGAGIVGNDSS